MQFHTGMYDFRIFLILTWIQFIHMPSSWCKSAINRSLYIHILCTAITSRLNQCRCHNIWSVWGFYLDWFGFEHPYIWIPTKLRESSLCQVNYVEVEWLYVITFLKWGFYRLHRKFNYLVTILLFEPIVKRVIVSYKVTLITFHIKLLYYQILKALILITGLMF
jgi:hypothetical protein